MKFYAGIGSRETPRNVLNLMTYIAQQLRARGYRLRSGGASGADTAFEVGAHGRCDIYIPWEGFNNRDYAIVVGDEILLRDIAIDHYPRERWHGLSPAAKRLMTRNSAQILGHVPTDEPLSEFVICCTPNGEGGGGTGQAIRVARAYGVPVYDLARVEDREKVKSMLDANPI